MKKILTVLLALSVVFTYTVGTAFAADVGQNTVYDQATAKAEEQLQRVTTAGIEWKDSLQNYFTESKNDLDKELKVKRVNVHDSGSGDHWFTAEGLDNLRAEVIAKAKAALDAEVVEITKDTYADQAALDSALTALKTIADNYDGISKFIATLDDDELADFELEYAKDFYLAYLNSIDPADYADTPNDDGDIYRDIVTEKKADAIEAIKSATAAFISDGSVQVIATEFYKAVKDIPTIEDQEEEFANLSEAIEYYQAKIESNLLEKKADVKYDLNQDLKDANAAEDTTTARNIQKALNRVESDFAAAIECAKAEIGYQKTIEDAKNLYKAWVGVVNNNLGYDETKNYEPMDKTGGDIELYVERAEKAAQLRAKAEEMKAETGFNGAPMYDAEAVDAALAADLEAAYTGKPVGALAALRPVEDQVKGEMDRVINITYNESGSIESTKVTLNKIKYDVVKAWTIVNVYDDEKLAEVESIQADALAAIRAAETVEAVDAAFLEAYAKYDAVPTKTDKSDYQSKTATKEQIAAYKAKLEAALKTKMANYGQAKFNEDYDVTDQKIAVFTGKLSENYLQEAYDAADLEAKYQEALDFIDDLRNKDQMKAEADAINAAIRDLAGKTLTAEDEDAVLAVAEREANFTEYKAILNVPTKYTTYGVDTYMRTMEGLIADQLEDAYKSIGTVTVEDEVAINTLVKMAETYTENYSKYTGYDSDLVNDIYALYDKLMDEKVKAVENAIGVIDASADPLDVKAIQAARDAYDALGEYAVDVNATRYHKLLSLENLAEEYIIESVESLKVIKNHSTAGRSNGKSWIRIEWSTQGDDSYVQGYEIYKSTKKNSGYKYSFTTKNPENKWYKNTAGLKKGTRYYYKVRAIVEVDGQKYTSDWSNKAYRIAK